MLKRISIRGFKSFADPTTLDFGPGVNVVVGPNGSGKSNLAEAIVWALGEQRSARLRAPGMQDVLYQGASSRPPAGQAEVVLQFDGDDDVAEMEVSRQLTRAGDAAYRLNRTTCRLLDVQEALATRALGGDALAVIRQGQVEAIATSRPEQRRAMLDEAAGVGVAKRRRRRAELKLNRIADKLDRARDLAGELAGRTKTLERQARAAERAAAIEAEMESLRERERIARAVVAAHGLTVAVSALEDARRGQRTAETELAARQQERERDTAEQARAGAVLERADAAATRVRSAQERVAGRAELAAERVAELESRQERLGAAKADAARRLVELAATEERIHGEIAAASGELRTAQEALDAHEATAATTRTAEMEAAETVRRLGAELASAEGALADAGRREDKAARAVQTAIDGLAQAAGPNPQQVARAERRDEIATRRVERDIARTEAAQGVWETASALLRETEQRLRDSRARADRLAPEERDGDGTALLGDGVEVVEGMERAVAAALGAHAEAVLCDDVAAAADAVGAGADAAVVPGAHREGVAPAGAVAVMSLVTDCPDSARPHLERLLSDTWLVEDVTSVPADHPGRFVTREGLAFTPGRGAFSAPREAWARRILHRRALEAVAAAEGDVAARRGEVDEADRARGAMRARRAASERAASTASRALAGLRAEAELIAGRRQRLELDRVESERLQQAAVRARGEAQAAVHALGGELEVAQSRLAAARDGVRHLDAALEEHRASVRSARAAASAADARAGEVQAAAAAARALVGRADILPERLALVTRAAAALTELAATLTPAAETLREGLARARESFRTVESRIAEAHRRVEAAGRAAGDARGAAERAEVEHRVANERAVEAGPVPDELPEEVDDPQEVAGQLADLERRRLNIGAVNALAASERTELAERERHLVEQIDDLEASRQALAGHLTELDDAVDEGFEAMFNAVATRFSEVVGLLFPGGTGRLRLVEPEDEDGEQGIEVEVVPANKRPRAMSLMSGGERSLIAMSFLLSLAMSRPAPFYLLDEVEAALDDANLRRFLGVLRRLSGETQFIVITHQQPTVEIADTLFGVTMGGNGVSQILSRRLAQSVEGPARPYVRRQLRLVGS